MGKWAYKNLANIFLRLQKGPRWSDFSGDPHATNAALKELSKKALRGTKKKINIVSEIFNFCKNDYNLAKNTEFLAKSIFSSSTNFDLLMTNNDVLEL